MTTIHTDTLKSPLVLEEGVVAFQKKESVWNRIARVLANIWRKAMSFFSYLGSCFHHRDTLSEKALHVTNPKSIPTELNQNNNDELSELYKERNQHQEWLRGVQSRWTDDYFMGNGMYFPGVSHDGWEHRRH